MSIVSHDSVKLENRTSDLNRLFRKIGKESQTKWAMTKGFQGRREDVNEERDKATDHEINSTSWSSPYNPAIDQGDDLIEIGTRIEDSKFPFLQYTAEVTYNDSLGVTDSPFPFSTSAFDLNHTVPTLLNATVTPAVVQAPASGYDILRWVHIPAYAVILCLAVVGNVLVIGTLAPRLLPRFPARLMWKASRGMDGPSSGVSVAGSWRVRSLTNVFLLNLAVADLLLGLLCVPFTLVGAILRDFVFGGAMCKLIPYLQAVSVSVSAWTLVAISVERYFAICHPLRSRRWQTLSHAYKLITLIWFGSLIAMAPVAALSELQPTSQGHHKCRERWPSLDIERAYNVLLDVVLLVLPLAILTATYSLITCTLRRGMRLERAQRKRARKASRKGSSRRGRAWKATRVPGQGAENSTPPTAAAAAARLPQGTDGAGLRHLDAVVPGDPLAGGGVSEVYLERNGSTATRCCRKRPEDAETPRDRRYFRRARFGGAAQSAEDEDSDESDGEEEDGGGGGELRRSDAERSLRSKRRVIRMLFVLVLEFFVCWTPLHALNTAASFFGAHAVYSGIGGYPAVAACHLLAYCSSCCNPITYGFMNARFRQAFLGAFGCHRRGKRTAGNQVVEAKGATKASSKGVTNSASCPGGKLEDRASVAFALSYTRGDSAALRDGNDDCTDSLSEFLPPLIESTCMNDPRKASKKGPSTNNR
ncbi:gastrin/cholecystokinin type B receptor-like [Ischnura elegans]|uniref:gastrin/cholecystokinin type B receptor-like n=1 Tax=Ischnura elegans TaxID=197161 RepID=UPI001ED8AC48|nr:gastrin/cholecystokinin type B receptor-like [Ischnura elegans]